MMELYGKKCKKCGHVQTDFCIGARTPCDNCGGWID